MIPIRLSLQGIYSYQEKQTIDFTRLTEAHLFGIFGSVGSGKSTILEAITFALYGVTDRLNQKGDDRNYNMMNLKSNELYIEFVFRTGRTDNEYRATVKGRRNSRNFYDVKTLDRAAYQLVSNEWQPIETEVLEDVIGLSYENFKRTVIIPQGRFQEFLQLGNSDRTKMMKELFNLEKFELFFKVTSLESKNNQQLQTLDGQLQQIGEIAPEQIQTIENALALVKNEISEKTNERELQQLQEAKLRKLKDITGKIAQSSVEFSRLKAQEPDFALMEKTIREYEYCLLNFKYLLDALEGSSSKISNFEKTISNDQELLGNTEKKLSDLEQNFTTLQKAFEGREQLHQQADELEKIARINSLSTTNETLSKRISEGETVCNKTIEIIKQLTDYQESTTISIKEIKALMPNMLRLSEAKDWFTKKLSLRSIQNEISLELKAATEELQGTEKARMQLLEKGFFAGLTDSCLSSEMEATLKITKERLQHSIKELDGQIQHLKVQSRLEEYATNLEEGLPCPLCGALSHPQPLNAQSVSEAIAVLQKKKTDFEAEINTLEQVQKQVSEFATAFRLNEAQRGKLLVKQKENEANMAAHQTLFLWEELNDEKAITEAFMQAEKLQNEVKVKESEREALSLKLQQKNQNKEKFNIALEGFRHQLTANNTETETLIALIHILKLSDFKNRTAEEIEHEKVAILQKSTEIERSYQLTNTTLNSLQKTRDTLVGVLKANENMLEQERITKIDIETKLQHQLGISEYSLLSDVKQILINPIPVELEKKKISNFKLSLDVLEKQLREMQYELGEQTYDEDVYQQVFSQLDLLAEEISQKNQLQGKLQEELKNTKAKLEAHKELLERVNALRLRGEEIKTLKQLFKGSGFVSYISTVYLQELCRAANDRFYKLTKQRLSLEVTDENNFQVRDFINGGKVRNVKTLSGGQTFQAALCLALALADNIQKITESSQNFFFLDEGFGSLDKESLDIVFDTLKSLRKENRIVGVISHVEDMQQEIDTHLRIMNEEERGSRIFTSWGECI